MADALPLSLDSEAYQRLVVVKQAYEDAVSRTSLDSRSARMLALIVFEFSVETLLRLAHKALQPGKQIPPQFQSVLKNVHDDLLLREQSGVAEYGEIDRMHQIRNGVQHHAEYPTENQIARVRTAAGICLRHTILSIWDENLNRIDEIELVATPKARAFLGKAKNCLTEADADYFKLAAWCWKAFTEVLDVVKAAFVGGSDRSDVSIVTIGAFDRQYKDRGLYEGLFNTQDLTLLLAFGIDIVRYLKYRSIIGNMHTPFGAEEVTRSIDSDHDAIEADDAFFVYSFCLESILRIESRVGPVVQSDWKPAGPLVQRLIKL